MLARDGRIVFTSIVIHVVFYTWQFLILSALYYSVNSVCAVLGFKFYSLSPLHLVEAKREHG